MTAIINSFQDLTENYGRFLFVSVDTNESMGYNGSALAGFIVGFILVGLLLGAVVGYFAIVKRGGESSLPGLTGFLNPIFKS